MTTIASTSGRLHSEFIRILFLQTHRETDRFFAASGVLSVQSNRGFVHYHRVAFSSTLKSRVGNILDKSAALRINLNIEGTVSLHNKQQETCVFFRDTLDVVNFRFWKTCISYSVITTTGLHLC